MTIDERVAEVDIHTTFWSSRLCSLKFLRLKSAISLLIMCSKEIERA